ncbi:MAG TPA: UDP-N-acetylmuramoyl-L-alanine--D-glutamate ligase [Burkholderiales bacterium]|nr:UDP-N-acetylmuramoyl-L-alanine--D-glutamate ligase [Burkholderiales bacterium]
MNVELSGKKVLVLGLGDSGLSMARWLTRKGAQVRVADSRKQPPHAAQLAIEMPQVPLESGPFRDSSFSGIDMIAISPGVALRESRVSEALNAGVFVAGDVELFAQALKSFAEAKVIAVTGSNGKSTVTSMAGAMCRAADLNTVVAGNIGLPVLDALTQVETQMRAGKKAPDVFVLELSSFQLETTHSLDASAATVLNLCQDHLDRYSSMDEYAAAKARIFSGHGVQVVNRDDDFSRRLADPARTVLSFGLGKPGGNREWGLVASGDEPWLAQGEVKLMPLEEMPLAGLHNASNALAALALCRAIDIKYAPLLSALKKITGLPHRVQKIAEIRGVAFYDDSKGTNVGATVAALTGMPQKVVLIAGGDGKGQDFSPLKSAIAAHARALVLIGRDADKITKAVAGCGVPLLRAATMEDAVILSFSKAQRGDAVLLSPACASIDMFRNYEHRAEVFVHAVQGLQAQPKVGAN